MSLLNGKQSFHEKHLYNCWIQCVCPFPCGQSYDMTVLTYCLHVRSERTDNRCGCLGNRHAMQERGHLMWHYTCPVTETNTNLQNYKGIERINPLKVTSGLFKLGHLGYLHSSGL
jgi:hypothetical protein